MDHELTPGEGHQRQFTVPGGWLSWVGSLEYLITDQAWTQQWLPRTR